MRNKWILFGGWVILAALLAACGTAYAQTPSDTSEPPRTLNVNGRGEVFLTPDIAYISIGVRTENEDAVEAMASNNAQAKEVIDLLKEMGVAAKDIQTTNFSIYPQHEYDNDGKVIKTKYVVENTVYVTIRDLGEIGKILDAAVKSGANNIYGIQFDASDKEAAASEARKKAVENAQAQAKELAGAAGVTLGEIQTISSYGGGYPTPIVYERRVMAEAAAAEVPISAGQLSISIEVNIVYEIK